MLWHTSKTLCDEELFNVTKSNALFKLQARYVVERMDVDLWEKVLNPDNVYRRQLIDQVVSTALPESKSPSQVSVVVKALMTADKAPNVANLQNVGDRLDDEALYEAAKIIFAFISNWAKLGSTLVKLRQFQGAVDAARKANS